jgi:hypothetical protein
MGGRGPRWAAWLALLTSGLTLGLLVAAVLLPARTPGGLTLLLPQVLWAGASGVVGAVVAARRPRLPIGWLLVGIGLLMALGVAAGQYAVVAVLDAPGSLPFGSAAAWLSAWPFAAGFLLLPFLFLLFPTGRLPGPRWRPLAWAGAVVYAANVFGVAFQPGPINPEELGPLENPLAIPALGGPGDLPARIVIPLMLLVVLASVASLLVRLRRSAGAERQQLKWFAYAAGLFGLATFVNVVASQFGADQAGLFVTTLPVVALPAAIGVAVLRHNLFDIDRVINRTLVFALLSALLGGLYLAVVFLLGRLLVPVTGDAALAVAGSTLAVAALFQPARRRIQAVVDRRFNRRRYDAARTVEGFAARLRDHVDLDALHGELLGVVDATVQPTSASLWLRPSQQPRHTGT